MRTLLLSTLLFTTFATAQTESEKAAMEQYSGQGMPVIEKDDSPYVPNTFIGSFIMDITTNDDKSKEPQTMSMHYASSADMTSMRMVSPEMQDHQMTMMTDQKNKFQYMLMTDKSGNKTAMKTPKMKINLDSFNDKASTEDSADGEVIVTNETKTIEGHVCTKIITKSKDGTWTGWVARDLEVPFSDIANSMTRSKTNLLNYDADKVKGFPMEFEMVDVENNTTIISRTHDLKVGEPPASTFSLDGYEVMELPMMVPGMMGK